MTATLANPPVVAIKDHPLAQFVISTLTSQGHPNPTGWLLHNADDPIQGNDQMARIQINNLLRRTLATVDFAGKGNTVQIRTALINDGSIDEWTTLIPETALRAITAHNAPIHLPNLF